MSETGVRHITLTFDRDLSTSEIEELRQKTDALDARLAMAEAAHHHDVTPLA